jgi:hypothetical protein
MIVFLDVRGFWGKSILLQIDTDPLPKNFKAVSFSSKTILISNDLLSSQIPSF